MSAESQNSQTAVDAVSKLFQILAPLGRDDRERAITAVMILLGHPPGTTSKSVVARLPEEDQPQEAFNGISPKAAAWMKKHGINREQLDHIFSIDGGTIEVIASKMLGTSKRQQTVEAYVVCGLKSFLQTGEPNFTDKEAREVCLRVGCYDTPNHSNYMKALGNLVSGSKEAGWKLSNPGMSKAAEIVKQLTQGANG